MNPNPFLKALQKKMSEPKTMSKSKPTLDAPPRIVTLTHADMPALKKKRPGDQVTAHIRGVIHSMDNEGNVQVHIKDVVDPSVNFQNDEEK